MNHPDWVRAQIAAAVALRGISWRAAYRRTINL